VEYARAVLEPKRGKCAFLNFCLDITAECDCIAKDDPRLMPNLGLLAGTDPVALDQACFDLVVKTAGRDVFHAAHPRRDGSKQLRYAEELGWARGTTNWLRSEAQGITRRPYGSPSGQCLRNFR